MLARLAGLIRLVHPFPSLLNAFATTAVASLAGGEPATAVRLGLSMLGLQASIGALNDLVDAPSDAAQKPAKPIPLGLVSRELATAVAAVAGAVGLGLSVPSGAAVVVVALAGLSLGYAYDLWLSRTALSWLPLAVALPLLPIHAWLGGTGSVPAGLIPLLPAALLAGAALAIGNGLVDAARDAAAGRHAIVVVLGARRAWLVHGAALGIVGTMAVLLAPGGPASQPGAPVPAGEEVVAALRVARTFGVAGGLVVLAAGGGLLAARRASVRERGWELEAIGVAAIGLGWLAGVAAAATG